MHRFFQYVPAVFFSLNMVAQHPKKHLERNDKNHINQSSNFPVLNDSIPLLIPNKKNGLFGFVNKKGEIIIPHKFEDAGFFHEDCTLLNSPNVNIRKFGSKQYASVTINGNNYRINKKGKTVYLFRNEDIGKCTSTFQNQRYYSYISGGLYGIIDKNKFDNQANIPQFQITPKYQYLYVMEGNDINHPMIIAVYNDRFGIIDKNETIIIPFEYEDIKRNFSWKIAHLFKVSKDGRNYHFIDSKNKTY